MHFFRTLTRQFGVITIILLLFVGINTYSDFLFTHRMKGKAAGIDYAGQIKSNAFEMAWLAERLAEMEIISLDRENRARLIEQLSDFIEYYDLMFDSIRNGNKELELRPITDPEMILILDTVENNWQMKMRPALKKIVAISSGTDELTMRRMVHQYDENLHSYGYHVDRLVNLMLFAYENEISKFDIFRLYVLGVFCMAAVGTIMYIRQNIVKPLRRFARAAHEIEEGNLEVHIEVTNRDEIGQFAEQFNVMAARLKDAFGEIKVRSENMYALNRASNNIAGYSETGALYNAICRSAMEMFSPKMAWIGLIKEGSQEIKPVASAGINAGYVESIRIAWDDSSLGMGPGGTAIKTGRPQVINDIGTDPSFAPWRSNAKDRGYQSCLVVPLVCAQTAVIGILDLYSENLNYFSEEKIELYQIFANQAAIVIENITLVDELENKVSRRTHELEDALLLAESANAAKSAFLLNMSHDLRTPLNAIIGFSEAMSQGIYGEMRADHKEYLEYIYQSGIKLLKLINEILDLSRMESGNMDLEFVECSVSDMINGALYIFREKAKKHRIAIDFDVAENAKLVTVDEHKIKQILVNLLTDSIKSVPDGGKIYISASRLSCSLAGIPEGKGADSDAAGTDAECIRIAIEDSRAPISESERTRFFDPYREFDTTLERKQDSVGLLLSKKFVDLHGGRIWSEGISEKTVDGEVKNSGNRFVFVLPQRS